LDPEAEVVELRVTVEDWVLVLDPVLEGVLLGVAIPEPETLGVPDPVPVFVCDPVAVCEAVQDGEGVLLGVRVLVGVLDGV
jgi:hypothetical protein